MSSEDELPEQGVTAETPLGTAGRRVAPGPSAALAPLAGAELDDLLRELLLRVDQVMEDQRRLRLLLDAVVAIAADLDVDSVLEGIVEVACELADARYGALGVLGAGPEMRLSAFITHGLPDAERERIGHLPRGHGLLGHIIDHPEPLRLDTIADHPRSYGFPADHPPMKSFLGVPIRIRDKVFGNLYLTEKRGGGRFTEQDESIVVALAAAAGVVIENARLYEESARRERWLAASGEITALLLGEVAQDDALQAVADRAREIARADVSCIVLRHSETELDLRIVSGMPLPPATASRLTVADSLAGMVISTGETVVLENVGEEARAANDVILDAGWPALGPLIMVPLRTSAGVEGALSLAWTPPHATEFYAVDIQLPQRFAEQAALALQVARARDDRARLSVFEDRDRIARDLHDLVIQSLFAIGLSLENAIRLTDHPEVTTRMTSAVDDLDSTIKDIRRSIFALSTAPDSVDVRTSVSGVVDRAARALKLRPRLRFEGPVNTLVDPAVAEHLLAVLNEALTNVSRHAGTSDVDVVLTAGDDIELTVTDAGTGMPADAVLSGVRNLHERAERLGGSCWVQSVPGSGTCVTWRVPVR